MERKSSFALGICMTSALLSLFRIVLHLFDLHLLAFSVFYKVCQLIDPQN